MARRNDTHMSRLARLVQDRSQLTYTQALAACQQVADAGLLTPPLDGAGLDVAAQTVLTHLAQVAAAATAIDAALEARARVPADQRTVMTSEKFAGPVAALDPGVTVGCHVGHGGRGEPVSLSTRQLLSHTLVLGGTQAERGQVLGSVAGQLLSAGWSGVVVGMAHDRSADGLPAALAAHAAAARAPFAKVVLTSSSTGGPWLDLLAGLSADEATQVLWDAQGAPGTGAQDALAHDMLAHVVDLHYEAYAAHPERLQRPTPFDILAMCQPAALTRMSRRLLELVPASGRYQCLVGPSRAQMNTLEVMSARLGNALDTAAGRATLAPRPDGAEPVDLAGEGLAYVGVDCPQSPATARAVATALGRQFLHLVHTRVGASTGGTPRFVVIDDAAQFDHATLVDLLCRARAAEVAMIVAAGGPDDWSGRQGEWSALTRNINITLAMRHESLDAAARTAKQLGGDGVSTQTLRELPRGVALVRVESPSRGVHQVRLALPTPEPGAPSDPC